MIDKKKGKPCVNKKCDSFRAAFPDGTNCSRLPMEFLAGCLYYQPEPTPRPVDTDSTRPCLNDGCRSFSDDIADGTNCRELPADLLRRCYLYRPVHEAKPEPQPCRNDRCPISSDSGRSELRGLTGLLSVCPKYDPEPHAEQADLHLPILHKLSRILDELKLIRREQRRSSEVSRESFRTATERDHIQRALDRCKPDQTKPNKDE